MNRFKRNKNSFQIRHNKKIAALNLQSMDIGDKGAKYITDAMQNNTKLALMLYITSTRLYLSGNKDPKCDFLEKKSSMSEERRNISIAHSEIENEGIQYLVDWLKNNKTLQRLDLTNSGNAPSIFLALTELVLDNNQIGDNDIEYLSKILQNHPILIKIGLKNN
ncbi:unnamed protein product [Adineta ricciae]|uniref:Uncharacterized protein n=1 Tax=Adineta ricciae TaxID=249248 RepID=A0A815P690_ADIRI|nr:unnamed protein product [Adineta ricciae]